MPTSAAVLAAATCATCGLAPGAHKSDPIVASTIANIYNPLAPTATVADMVRTCSAGGDTMTATPAHWVGEQAFASLLRFNGIGAVIVLSVGSSKHPRFRGVTKWKCNASDALGNPCEATFGTRGVDLVAGMGKAGCAVDFAPHPETDGVMDPIALHMRTVHGLRQQAAGRWTERFWGFCDDPRVAMTVLCPVIGVTGTGSGMCRPDGGHGICCANQRVLGVQGGLDTGVVHSAPLHTAQCGSQNVFAVFMLPFLPHAVAVGALVTAVSIITMCGFPCNNDRCSPLICHFCFENRRRMVRKLAADEPNWESRAKVVFCCPCSEAQIWREIRASGVWPGLLCCSANDNDLKIMSPSSVRSRYQISGGNINGIVSDGGNGLSSLSKFAELEAPKIGFLMS